MAFDRNSLGFIEKKLNHVATIANLIKIRRFRRAKAFLIWMLWWPYFIVLGFFLFMVSWMKTRDTKRLEVWFLKHYFRRFFKAKHVDWYTIFDIHPLEPSTIILSTRTHAYHFPFVLQLFSDTVIVPMPTWFHKLKMVPLIFYLSLSRFLSRCSYPDQELPSAMPTIKALLEAGFPVVVPVNRGYAKITDNTITLYKQVEELMRLNYPCYFLSAADTDLMDIAISGKQALVPVKLKSKNDVLAGLPIGSMEARVRMAEFFGFRYLSVI